MIKVGSGGASVSSATPQAVGTAAAGTGTAASRDDHVHAHGNQLGGTLHSAAVAGVSAGFIAAADQTKLDALSGTNTGDEVVKGPLTKFQGHPSTSVGRITFINVPSHAASTVFTNSGGLSSALTVSGNVAGSTTANPTGAKMFIKHTTGGTSGDYRYIVQGNFTRWSLGQAFYACIMTDSAVTSTRLFAGFGNNGSMNGSDTPVAAGTPSAYFRFSTNVGGETTWKCVSTSSNAGEAAVATDSLVTVNADTVYYLAIDCSTAGSAKFYINGSLVANKVTVVPNGESTNMSPIIHIETLTGSARSVNVASISWDRNP